MDTLMDTLWTMLGDDPVMTLAIGVGVMVGLAMLLLIAGINMMNAERSQLQNRLQAGFDPDLEGLATVAMEENLSSAQIAERLNTMIARRSFGRRLAGELAQANLPFTVAEYVTIRVAIPLVLAVLAFALWRTPLAIAPAVFIGAVVPTIVVVIRRNQRRHEFADQLPETLGMIVSSLRGGFSLVQALRVVARESREPTRSEFERTAQEIQVGLSLSDAIDNLAERVGSEDMDLIVSAIKINARIGGNLSEILENITDTIRERSKLRREVRVITSMQRISAIVVGLLPVVLTLIISTINPEYMMRIFQPGWPLIIPATAGFFALTGFLVIQKIVDIKV